MCISGLLRRVKWCSPLSARPSRTHVSEPAGWQLELGTRPASAPTLGAAAVSRKTQCGAGNGRSRQGLQVGRDRGPWGRGHGSCRPRLPPRQTGSDNDDSLAAGIRVWLATGQRMPSRSVRLAATTDAATPNTWLAVPPQPLPVFRKVTKFHATDPTLNQGSKRSQNDCLETASSELRGTAGPQGASIMVRPPVSQGRGHPRYIAIAFAAIGRSKKRRGSSWMV
jgi:hypothetical protein